ncbi:flightin [Drosophila kikkawai]|uniref:Flightin n=1 Tax=Drosophila kikkawai TaxID=30033 RepID=A0A6P4IZX0_DROKI|nr:flightin [Drosophila kikkawai]XP_017034132.1 flightin [Drosophila kikkawai]
MGDEEDPWGFDDGGAAAEEPSAGSTSNQGTPAPPSKAPSVASDHKSESVAVGGTPAGEEAAAVEEEIEFKAPPPPPEDDGYRKPVQLYRHWVRPKFLQYKYMYNYRTNYYDDVIDYIDKKQTGVARDIPRPQTWAERVLRTRNISSGIDSFAPSAKRDKQLIQTLAASIRTYNYHTKAYINQRYASVL